MRELSALGNQVLDGKYRLDKLLGQGGMGAVFKATHFGTDRVVALKVIAPGLMDQQEFVSRFQREARAAGRLRHPNIVDMTDFGFAEVDGTRIAYLVMEYLEGESLAALLSRNPTPPIAFLVELVKQVGSALQEAHDNGIIHRDLKPENLWLEPDRLGGYRMKILDFGLAKIYAPKARAERDSTHSSSDGSSNADRDKATEACRSAMAPTRIVNADPLQTEVGTAMGTPAYMSPEQCRGLELDHRADIYSLGVILYQLLSGRTPFSGNSLDLINQHIQCEAPDLRTLRKDLPVGMTGLVMECLAKDPRRRPESAEILGNAFEALATTRWHLLQQATAFLVDRWREVGLRAWPAFILPAALLGITFCLALLFETRLEPFPRKIAASYGFLASLGAFIYGYATLKGRLAPLVLLHTLYPLQSISVAWMERVDQRAAPLSRFLALNVAIVAVLFLTLPGGLALLARMDAVPKWAILIPILIPGFLFGLLNRLNHKQGASAGSFTPCVLLVENIDPKDVRKRVRELRDRGLRNGMQPKDIGENGLFLIAMVYAFTVGMLALEVLVPRASEHDSLRVVAFSAGLGLASFPVFVFFALTDAVATTLQYLRLRKIARESMRKALADLEQRISGFGGTGLPIRDLP